jgi:hypothetical protein
MTYFKRSVARGIVAEPPAAMKWRRVMERIARREGDEVARSGSPKVFILSADTKAKMPRYFILVYIQLIGIENKLKQHEKRHRYAETKHETDKPNQRKTKVFEYGYQKYSQPKK